MMKVVFAQSPSGTCRHGADPVSDPSIPFIRQWSLQGYQASTHLTDLVWVMTEAVSTMMMPGQQWDD